MVKVNAYYRRASGKKPSIESLVISVTLVNVGIGQGFLCVATPIATASWRRRIASKRHYFYPRIHGWIGSTCGNLKWACDEHDIVLKDQAELGQNLTWKLWENNSRNSSRPSEGVCKGRSDDIAVKQGTWTSVSLPRSWISMTHEKLEEVGSCDHALFNCLCSQAKNSLRLGRYSYFLKLVVVSLNRPI